jgi:hypothetical protein
MASSAPQSTAPGPAPPALRTSPSSNLVKLDLKYYGGNPGTLPPKPDAPPTASLDLGEMDHGAPRRVAPPNLPGTGAPLPAGFLQFTPDLFGHIISNWYFAHNSHRLAVASKRGMTIEQLTCSPTSGLIEFPGFGDALVPEEVSALDCGHPQQVDRICGPNSSRMPTASKRSPDAGAPFQILSPSGSPQTTQRWMMTWRLKPFGL